MCPYDLTILSMMSMEYGLANFVRKVTRLFGASVLVIGIIIIPSIQGACVTLTDTNAVNRSAAITTISWHIENMAAGCKVSLWTVHYDTVSPVNIYQNRNNSGSYVNMSYVRVYPNFEYRIYVDAVTSQGDVVRSPVIQYHAPKTIPSAAPENVHMTSVSPDSIGLAWGAVNLFYRNGDVLGYKISYKLAGNSTAMSTTVSGESTLTSVLHGLTPSTHYQIHVQCLNDIGLGRPSTPWLDVTTKNQPITSTTTTMTTPTVISSQATIPPSTNVPAPTTTIRTQTPTNSHQSAPTTSLHVGSSMTASRVSPNTGSSPTNFPPVLRPKSTARHLAATSPASTTTSKDDEDDKKILGLDLWMLVAIGTGVLLLLLLLAVLLCCCFRCCCFEEAAVGAKKREEERIFDKRRMDEMFAERSARKEEAHRRSRTKSTVSMQSVENYGASDGGRQPRAMRLVSVDSHNSLDAVPILIPTSASRYPSRHSSTVANNTGTQYERINTTPRTKPAGTQYEDVTERYIYPTLKSRTFGTQYERIEEEPTRDVGTITDRRGSLPPSMASFPSSMTLIRPARSLEVVVPVQVNPETETPIVRTMDASTSAMSSPERRLKSANCQTDLSVLKPPTPRPPSHSTRTTTSKSTGYPVTADAGSEALPVPVFYTTQSEIAVNDSFPASHEAQKLPRSDIASCPTVVPLRSQDIPKSRDHSFLRYPSKAASHPMTIWDIPLKSVPDSLSDYPANETSLASSPPPVNRIEYNTIYDNRVSNTDNTYIHNFLDDARKMAPKPKVSRQPRLATIPANMRSPMALYDPYLEENETHDTIKPGNEKQTSFNNIPVLKGREPRAILYEPHRLQDSSNC